MHHWCHPQPSLQCQKCSFSFFTSVTFVSGRHSAIYASIWLSKRNRFSRFFTIACQHDGMDALIPQSFDGCHGFITHDIFQSEYTGNSVIIFSITIVLPCSANVSEMPFWNRSASLQPTKSAFPTCQSTPLMYARTPLPEISSMLTGLMMSLCNFVLA